MSIGAITDCPLRPCGLGLRGRGGFTLIEVLTALVIFSVALVAFIEGMGSAVRVQADLKARQQAEMLALNTLEELRLTGTFKEGTDQGGFEDENAPYKWQTDVAQTDYENLYEVTVTVTWDDGRGPMDVALTSLLRQEASE